MLAVRAAVDIDQVAVFIVIRFLEELGRPRGPVPLALNLRKSTVGDLEVGLVWDDAPERVRRPVDFAEVHFQHAGIS